MYSANISLLLARSTLFYLMHWMPLCHSSLFALLDFVLIFYFFLFFYFLFFYFFYFLFFYFLFFLTFFMLNSPSLPPLLVLALIPLLCYYHMLFIKILTIPDIWLVVGFPPCELPPRSFPLNLLAPHFS